MTSAARSATVCQDATDRRTPDRAAVLSRQTIARVALLTGGSDPHYAIPLAAALSAGGIALDFIGSDQLDRPDVRGIERLTFFNLRGDQRDDAGVASKAGRVIRYYARLMGYAAAARAEILHILWNNKFELFDRTLLMLYYRLLGKRIALTAHNVNAAERDRHDGLLNRLSLRIQYRLCDCLFVHTERMKVELVRDYGVRDDAVIVIPYGINNMVPSRGLTSAEARRRLGLRHDEKALLFFGRIAPYKGLDHLVEALVALAQAGTPIRLIVAGRIARGCEEYWRSIERTIDDGGIREAVIERIGFLRDEEIEGHVMAADAMVLPYTHIFQSGVAFLAQAFGAPIIASDVGSLREDVVDGRTGFLCRPADSADLAKAIERFFSSDLYRALESRREEIRRGANERHSWEKVGEMTVAAYSRLCSAS